MTLKDAIDLSKAAADDMDLQDMPRFAEAVRLTIEASERMETFRVKKYYYARTLLPSETEE